MAGHATRIARHDRRRRHGHGPGRRPRRPGRQATRPARPPSRSSTPSSTRAASSAAAATRCPAVSTASASSVVNALSEWLQVEIRARRRRLAQEYARGKPTTPVKKIGPQGARQRHDSPASAPTRRSSRRSSTRSTRSSSACASRRTSPRASGSRSSMSALDRERSFYFEGGLVSFVRHLNRNKEVAPSPPDLRRQAGRQHHGRGRAPVQRLVHRERPRLRQQHQHASTAAPTSPASGAPSRAPSTTGRSGPAILKDADGNLSGEDVREGLTAVISVKLTEPQFEGQTKAKLGNAEVKGQVEAAVADGARPVPRGEPGRRPPDHREVPDRGARTRGRPQGARPRHPQGRAGGLSAARQARRLPGARPGEQRDLHRRGRLGRWLRQAGPRPALPGHPAAARQDAQRREGPPRQDPRRARTSSR